MKNNIKLLIELNRLNRYLNRILEEEETPETQESDNTSSSDIIVERRRVRNLIRKNLLEKNRPHFRKFRKEDDESEETCPRSKKVSERKFNTSLMKRFIELKLKKKEDDDETSVERRKLRRPTPRFFKKG